MSRHRTLLLALGVLQLLAAGALWLDHLGASIKGVEYRTYESSKAIADSLRTAGVGVPPMDSSRGSAAFEAIARPVRSGLRDAEDRVGLTTLAFLGFAVGALALGVIPERRRPTIHPEG